MGGHAPEIARERLAKDGRRRVDLERVAAIAVALFSGEPRGAIEAPAGSVSSGRRKKTTPLAPAAGASAAARASAERSVNRETTNSPAFTGVAATRVAASARKRVTPRRVGASVRRSL